MTHRSLLKDFTSGGQLTMHAIRMFGQALRSIFWFSLMIFGCVWVFCGCLEIDPYDGYLFMQKIHLTLKSLLQGDRALHWIQDGQGQWVQGTVAQLIEHPQILVGIDHCLAGLKKTFYQACSFSLLSVGGVGIWFYARGRRQSSSQELHGQVRVTPKVLTKQLNRQKKASPFKVASVPLLKEAEVQHLLLMGTTGTGKSLCLEELMDQIRAQKQRAIVYDIEGTFIPHYYREGIDFILNPLDNRCPAWNIWQEGDKASDFESMASSLMPLHLAGTDPFWIHSARTIFSCVAQRLQVQDQKTMRALLEPLFSEQLGALSKLVLNSPAESLVSDKNEKTALSIKATLSTYCKALMYLKDEGSSLFSIERWVQADDQDSWLFIATDAQKIEALKPLISVWMDVAAKAVLSLKPSSSRRLWFLLDELPSLHRLPNLMNTLARGRKYGACFVAAIQDIHQLRAIYGRDEAETLLALFNTNLCYRTKCPDTAHWMSKVMGGLELLEHREGYSYGAHEMRDGVSIQQERRREPVVKEAEFLELNDLSAFLKLPGHWPVTHLKFEPRSRTVLAPAFVARDLALGKELLLFDATPSALTPTQETLLKKAQTTVDITAKQASQASIDSQKDLVKKPLIQPSTTITEINPWDDDRC